MVADRGQAILDATLLVVAEVGYGRATMDAVAARAGASKATIYRRWTGKQDLVLAAMQSYAGSRPVEMEATGTLRGDLLVQCRVLAGTIDGFDGRLILGLSQAALDDPKLSVALERHTGASGARLAQEVVDRAIDRGELPDAANAEIFAEVAVPLFLFRLISGAPLDEGFVEHVVDDIVLPALKQSSSSPG